MFWVWGCGWWVGRLYVHALVKNLLIKFVMMLFLVAKGCKFDSCDNNDVFTCKCICDITRGAVAQLVVHGLVTPKSQVQTQLCECSQEKLCCPVMKMRQLRGW